MKRICVIDVPGLSRTLLHAIPNNSSLGKWIAKQDVRALAPSWPAVTCSVQATITTGVDPAQHGIVSNGIATFRSPEDQKLIDASNFASYRREVSFWEQSNQFVQHKRFWQDDSRRSKYKTALLFFQNSMPGFVEPKRPAADIVITPKPEHGSDGKITSLLWTEPRDVVDQLGPFPLMKYWGPIAGIESSQWIAHAAAHVWTQHQPTLQFVYVPHLDYDLQRFGPDSPHATKAVIDLASALEPLFNAIAPSDEIMLFSEYEMKPVTYAIQPNQMLADAGLLVTRESPDGNLVDYERSEAFAMCDHQIAHVYTKSPDRVREVFATNSSIRILDREQTLPHQRAGELLLESAPDAWFDYRWWDPSDLSRAPTFATQVDIHRKPGYDPMELFFDPATRGTSQDNSRVRGSHGSASDASAVLIGQVGKQESTVPARDLAGLIEARLQ